MSYIVVVVVVGVWFCSVGIVISLPYLVAVFAVVVWFVAVLLATCGCRFQIVILRGDLNIEDMVWDCWSAPRVLGSVVG